jgi:hypothetical protein
MSLEMVYTIGEAQVSIPLRDQELLEQLAKLHPRECETVFGVEQPDDMSFQAPRGTAARTEMLAALDALLDALNSDPQLRPQRYVFDFDIIPGVAVTGHTEVSQVRLPGDDKRYTLYGGINQCLLRDWEVGPNGLPVYKGAVDLRGQTVLETEDHGPVHIRSERKRSPIAGDLKRLRQFLEGRSGATVTKELT